MKRTGRTIAPAPRLEADELWQGNAQPGWSGKTCLGTREPGKTGCYQPKNMYAEGNQERIHSIRW